MSTTAPAFERSPDCMANDTVTRRSVSPALLKSWLASHSDSYTFVTTEDVIERYESYSFRCNRDELSIHYTCVLSMRNWGLSAVRRWGDNEEDR